MTLVLDASAAVDALLPTRRQTAVLRMLTGHEIWAPQLIDLEVVSAIARLERAQQIDASQSSLAIADWLAMPLNRMQSDLLVDEVWRTRQSVRISDGFYVAAAKGLDASLVTSDARLARAPLADVTIALIR